MAIKRREKFDQIWCVFDRDSFTSENFNEAIILAKHHKIKVAYSNEAFELWYLLHFNYYETAFSRQSYEDMLTELLGYQYKKNCPTMYVELLNLQSIAINNANKLLTQYSSINTEQDNPSTTVHLLVLELNKWVK